MGVHGPPETSRRWADATGDVSAEVLDQLMGVMHAFRHVLVEEVSKHELTPMHLGALRALADPTPMGVLADQLHCDRSHVTGVADELERRGAIERRSHPSDRRVTLLALTDAGAALRDEIEAALLARSPVAAALSEAQQRQLRGLLARVAVHEATVDA